MRLRPSRRIPPTPSVDDFERGLYLGLMIGALATVVLWHLAVVFG